MKSIRNQRPLCSETILAQSWAIIKDGFAEVGEILNPGDIPLLYYERLIQVNGLSF